MVDARTTPRMTQQMMIMIFFCRVMRHRRVEKKSFTTDIKQVSTIVYTAA